MSSRGGRCSMRHRTRSRRASKLIVFSRKACSMAAATSSSGKVSSSGLDRVDWFYRLTIVAYHLVRMRRLIAIESLAH